ncbi:DUF6114 domain-containing protein [Kitasatospora sp. NPDC002040]|uniref:DUF6114 domain-containing protein n=1 Tax=Kitasatospora sp. NPDC002040 TaxID=3154661 RepID=UPI003332D041
MSSATVPVLPGQPGLVARARVMFRTWRRTRPFWGGLLAMVSGVPILYFPYAKLNLNGLSFAMSTTAGAGSLVIGLLMIALGLTAWFQPVIRIFAGVATTILALISIPVANLGGFVMGAVLGLVAGGLLVSWAPLKAEPALAAAESAEPPVEHLPMTGQMPVAEQGEQR